MKQHTFHTVTGDRRKYKLDLNDDIAGVTDIPDQKDNRRRTYMLYIRDGMSFSESLRVSMHESMHAIDPSASEVYVDRVSRESAKFVARYLREKGFLK